MKKTLVASAITLSIIGVSASTTYAEENQILPSTTTVEKTVISAVTEPREKSALISTEEVTNPTTSTTSTEPSSKSTEQVKKPEIKKEGWVQEENQWRYYENNKAVVNWKNSKTSGTTLIKKETALAILFLKATSLTKMESWLVVVGAN